MFSIASFKILLTLCVPSYSLKACYNRSVRLLMATLQLKNQSIDPNEIREAREEAAARHKDIASTLLSELRYWLGFLDDLLSCEIRSWNVRLCEFIMSDVIVDTVLLKWNLALVVLEDSGESIKASEEVKAKAEIRTSVYFIMQLLGMVEYVRSNWHLALFLLPFFNSRLNFVLSLSAPFG